MSSRPQEALLAILLKGEASIETLYSAVYNDAQMTSPRRRQQRIGAMISRLNKKLKGERIQPGTARRTYTIVRL